MAAVAATVPWQVNATANTKKIMKITALLMCCYFFIKTIKYSVNSIDNYGVKVCNILRQLIVKRVND